MDLIICKIGQISKLVLVIHRKDVTFLVLLVGDSYNGKCKYSSLTA